VHANRGKNSTATAADGSPSYALPKWPPGAPYLPNALQFRDPSVSEKDFKEQLLQELLAALSGSPGGRPSTDEPHNTAPDDDDDDEYDDDEDEDGPPDDRNQFETEEPPTEFEDMSWDFANNFAGQASPWHSDNPALRSNSQAQAHQYQQSSLAGGAHFISPQDHHYTSASMQSGSPYWPEEGQTQPSYDFTRSQYEQTNPAAGFSQEYRQSPHRTVEPRHLEGQFGNLRLRGGPQYPAPQQQQYGNTLVLPPLC
jgi:hypothetical protein